MIGLTGWRAIALLAVVCGLFLAADAVPKPSTVPKPPAVRASSGVMTEAEVRVKVAVPLLRKLAKYNPAWNEFLLYGPVNKHGSTDRTFEHAGDIFDSAFLDSYVQHLMDDTFEEGLEEISDAVWSISPQQMQESLVEAVSKLEADSSRVAIDLASLATKFTNDTDRAVAPGNGDVSERGSLFDKIRDLIRRLVEQLIEETVDIWPTAAPPTAGPRTKECYYDLLGRKICYYVGGGARGGAGGWGDPHLTGFDDRKFLLTGDAIHEYNLFSAENVALNTRMYVDKDKTFFKQFNLVANKDSLRVDMDPAKKTVEVTVNGDLLDRQDHVDTGNMSVKTEPVGKTNLNISVSTKTATFTFDTRLYKRPHLDFSLELARDLREEEAGGILGHTLHRGADVPHPADMADDEVVARYASKPVTAGVVGSR